MISRIEGWGWEVRADCIQLVASNVELGALRYFEKLRPLERLGDLLERHAGNNSASVVVNQISEVERLITSEGEYGALVRCDATADARPLRVALGFVFGDDYYGYLEGFSTARHGTGLVRTVRDLVIADKEHLGVRRRRYVFRAPPWQGVSLSGAITHYVSPSYPSDGSRITVYPAIPFPADYTPTIDLQRVLGEDLVVSEAGPSSGFVVLDRRPSIGVTTASGLPGTRWRITGRRGNHSPVERDIVLLRDAHYAYVVEVESDPKSIASAQVHFDALVETIQPIPTAAQFAVRSAAAFRHWAE